jgi:hypothetical protein
MVTVYNLVLNTTFSMTSHRQADILHQLNAISFPSNLNYKMDGAGSPVVCRSHVARFRAAFFLPALRTNNLVTKLYFILRSMMELVPMSAWLDYHFN